MEEELDDDLSIDEDSCNWILDILKSYKKNLSPECNGTIFVKGRDKIYYQTKNSDDENLEYYTVDKNGNKEYCTIPNVAWNSV